MSRRLRILLLAAALFGGDALQAGDYEFVAEMVTGADAEFKMTVPGGQMPQTGFLPLRVRINNRAASERSWRLELGSLATVGGYGAGAGLGSVHTFAVPAASTREFFIFAPVPALPDHRRASGISGTVSGPEVQRGDFTLHLSFTWGGVNPRVAAEPGLEARLAVIAADFAKASSVTPAGRYRSYPGASIQNVSIIDPSLWPADWRLWSSFATVLLDQSTWDKLDTARRRALLDWVALGGRLVRLNGRMSRDDVGAGTIVTLPGRTLTGGEINLYLLSDGSRSAEALASKSFWDLSPRQWQLVGKHRWLTGYIVLFGLLIGPVNLFYFAPAGRRHRMFYTVPLISVASAAALFGIITLSDGFGGTGTRRAIVLLQPAQNQAVVYQRQISRTGMLADRKFALPADAIMNLDADERLALGSSPQLWRDGDAASGDWFASRSVQQHSLTRLMPTRERVELVGPQESAPVIQSTVSSTLRDFVFVDQKGRIWAAAEVPPGTRVTLTETAGNDSPIWRYVPSLAPGTFCALGDGSGLIPTLASIRWRDDLVFYTGRLGATPEVTP